MTGHARRSTGPWEALITTAQERRKRCEALLEQHADDPKAAIVLTYLVEQWHLNEWRVRRMATDRSAVPHSDD